MIYRETLDLVILGEKYCNGGGTSILLENNIIALFLSNYLKDNGVLCRLFVHATIENTIQVQIVTH